MRRTFMLGCLLAATMSIADPAAASFVARGSAEQALVTGAKPGTRLALVDRRGRQVASQRAGSLGGARPGRLANVGIAHSPARPSRLILPVVDGIAVPTGLPPCPGLRGEPCRPYQAIENGG